MPRRQLRLVTSSDEEEEPPQQIQPEEEEDYIDEELQRSTFNFENVNLNSSNPIPNSSEPVPLDISDDEFIDVSDHLSSLSPSPPPPSTSTTSAESVSIPGGASECPITAFLSALGLDYGENGWIPVFAALRSRFLDFRAWILQQRLSSVSSSSHIVGTLFKGGDFTKQVSSLNGAMTESIKGQKYNEESVGHFKIEREEGELSPNGDFEDDNFQAYGDSTTEAAHRLKSSATSMQYQARQGERFNQ